MLECTPKFLDAQLAQLDMQNVELARIAGVAPTSVQRWLGGQVPVPRMVVVMLQLMIHIRAAEQLTKSTSIGMLWAAPEEKPHA